MPQEGAVEHTEWLALYPTGETQVFYFEDVAVSLSAAMGGHVAKRRKVRNVMVEGGTWTWTGVWEAYP